MNDHNHRLLNGGELYAGVVGREGHISRALMDWRHRLED